MGSILFDYEWKFLLQLVNRIHCCTSYEELCEMVFEQLPTAISFQSAVAFQSKRIGGRGMIHNPQISGLLDVSMMVNGTFPTWSEFIMSPSSVVFRQSDIISIDKWEQTRVYRNIWAPNHVYWGLMASIVNDDFPLALFGIYRDKDQPDFSRRDVFVMNAIVPALEIRLKYLTALPSPVSKGDVLAEKVGRIAGFYHLTRQETRIVEMIYNHKTNTAICEDLFIAPTTLHKHVSNIYKKTGMTNRAELAGLLDN